jgi:hypothetical protein
MIGSASIARRSESASGSFNPVKLRLKTFLISLAVGACAISVPAQTAGKALPHKAPELKIRIVPSKETYALHEKVFTKTEFTNLTDKTLCFPKPAQACQNTGSGSLITTGEAVATGEGEQFICHIDARGTPREELLREIEEQWVKVAPGAVHTSKTAGAQVNLDTPGQWRLKAAYHPPEASFGNTTEFRTFLQSTAERVGCAVPEMYVSAEPVTVNVVTPPPQQ